MAVPPGEDVGSNIGLARQFMASKDSYSPYHASRSNQYGPTVMRHDPKKIGAWLIAHVGDGNVWDYKLRTKDKRYDEFGHVNYAAVASELRIDLTTIIAAQEYIHQRGYSFNAAPEPIGGEVLGYNYDQNNYHPGPAQFSLFDFNGFH